MPRLRLSLILIEHRTCAHLVSLEKKICGGWFTEQIAHMIEDEIDLGKVNVTQLYADIYETEDNDAND